VSDQATEADQLERIEAKLDKVLGQLAAAEQVFKGFIGGGGITSMFRAIAKSSKD